MLGSLSKTLSPALGIGWVVTPPAWTEPLREVAGLPAWPSTLDQLTFAAFLQSGAYDRHLRAVRQRYRLRHDQLLQALAEHLPDAHLVGVAAGLHLLVLLDEVDVAAVVSRAATRGLRIANLDTYRCSDDAIGPGLVLDYGNLADSQLDEAVRLLATTLAETRQTGRQPTSGRRDRDRLVGDRGVKRMTALGGCTAWPTALRWRPPGRGWRRRCRRADPNGSGRRGGHRGSLGPRPGLI